MSSHLDQLRSPKEGELSEGDALRNLETTRITSLTSIALREVLSAAGLDEFIERIEAVGGRVPVKVVTSSEFREVQRTQERFQHREKKLPVRQRNLLRGKIQQLLK